MKKSNTLRKNKDFSFCYRRGKRYSTPLFSVYYVKARYNIRAGFSVSKKIGKAVVRNKVRRRMKESFSQLLPDMKQSCSLIFVAKPEIVNASYAQIHKCMQSVFEKVQ